MYICISMKKLTVIIFIISLLSQSWAQEPAYFNNVYQHNNYFSGARVAMYRKVAFAG